MFRRRIAPLPELTFDDDSADIDAEAKTDRAPSCIYSTINTEYTGSDDPSHLMDPKVYEMYQAFRRRTTADEWWLVVNFVNLDTTITVLVECDEGDRTSFNIEWYGGNREKIRLDLDEIPFVGGYLLYEGTQEVTNTATYYLDRFFLDMDPKHREMVRQGPEAKVEWPGFGPRGMLFVQWFLANIHVDQIDLADAWRRTVNPELAGQYSKDELVRRGVDKVAIPGSFLISSDEYANMIDLWQKGEMEQLERDTAYPFMKAALERDFAEMDRYGTVDNVIKSGWYGRFGYDKTKNEYGGGRVVGTHKTNDGAPF